ncbi:MAG: T9SS type A sorting domain-containing protein, partial [Bacteroidia bacterium]|nr:T9SS type A sorting domain-containing protein [Bacteroidia bacterium]
PYNEGYQILPRYITDFMPYLSTEDVYQGSINIYPNPVTNLLTIDAEDTFHSLGLYDLQGKLLLQGGNQKTIDVRSLESGCYILRIQFEDSHVLKPIIVNR